MARTKKPNPLEGLSQEQIEATMTIRPKDMTPLQIKIYKQVKYDAWIARGKVRAPREKKNTSTVLKAPSAPTSIGRTPSPNLPSFRPLTDLSTLKINIGSGKLPGWVKVPPLTEELRAWCNNRQISMTVNNRHETCVIKWKEGESLPTILVPSKEDVYLSWENTFCATHFAFVKHYNRDGIKKDQLAA